jgi:Tfp pilus assembly protein PilF
MSRQAFLLLLLAVLPAAGQQSQKEQKEQEPPEEDESRSTAKEYSFNPLQASKEVQIGIFYLKKGKLRAAAQRFDEATHWNPGLGEAWLRLAETREKLKDGKAAHEAYAKYLQLEPEAKNAAQIRKKLGKSK